MARLHCVQNVVYYERETERQVEEMKRRYREEMRLAEIGIRDLREFSYDSRVKEAKKRFRAMRVD